MCVYVYAYVGVYVYVYTQQHGTSIQTYLLACMLVPCSCQALAMLVPCSCHALAMLLPCSCHALAMLLDCVTLRSGLYCPALRLGRGEKVAPIPRDATAVLVDAVDPALRLGYRCRPNQQWPWRRSSFTTIAGCTAWPH